MKILRLFVAVALLGVSGIAAADPQSYTNFELSLGRQGNIQLNGGNAYRFAGSYDLSDTFYTYGQYSNNAFGDFPTGAGLDAKQVNYGLGLGMHFPVADATDWVVRLGLDYNKTQSSDSTSLNQVGHVIGTGFNTALTTGLELSAFIDHNSASTDATQSLLMHNVVDRAPETVMSLALHSQIGRNLDFGITEEYSTLAQSRLLFSLRWDF